MLKYVHKFILLGVILLVIAGCAAQQEGGPKAGMIEPKGFGEACVKLLPHQMLEYSFSTSKPVDFNIHYHQEDNKVVYPVVEENISSREGVLDLREYSFEESQNFCLMWENPHNEYVDLTYEYTVRDE